MKLTSFGKPTSFGLLMLCWFIAGSAGAQNSCSLSITSCGCTITRPGNYIVDADLSASQGLTALNGCIDISVEHTKLFLNGHAVNADTQDFTDIGIHVLPTAKYTFIEGGTPNVTLPFGTSKAVSNWRFGIESEADNVLIDLPAVQGNNGAGVLLKGTYNNRVVGVGGLILASGDAGLFLGAAFNGYGIWIVGGNSNQVDGAYSEYNEIAGIYIGCSETGPTGTPCPPGQASTGNVVYNYGSSSPSDGNTQLYGIVLEVGSIHNTVANNAVGEDTLVDLYDDNANCADNVWRLNGAGVNPGESIANQACIH
jgi:hypothetical protein